METLAVRMMDDVKGVIRLVAEEVHPDWQTATNRFFDTIVAFYQHAATRELWVGGHLSRPARQADDDANAWAAQRLEHMLSIAQVPGPRLDLVCYRVAVEMVDYVMRLAYRADGDERTALLREARHACLAYLTSSGDHGRR
jgi:hypothetical protein